MKNNNTSGFLVFIISAVVALIAFVIYLFTSFPTG